MPAGFSTVKVSDSKHQAAIGFDFHPNKGRNMVLLTFASAQIDSWLTQVVSNVEFQSVRPQPSVDATQSIDLHTFITS